VKAVGGLTIAGMTNKIAAQAAASVLSQAVTQTILGKWDQPPPKIDEEDLRGARLPVLSPLLLPFAHSVFCGPTVNFSS
jgi:hypothetical protein